MKEFLVKFDGGYKLVVCDKNHEGIEIPEGADIAFKKIYTDGISFTSKDWMKDYFEGKLIDRFERISKDYEENIVWQREKFEVEVGDVNLGRKFDNDKIRFSLLPKGSVTSVIKVLEFGAKKYDTENWKLVSNSKERYYNAAMRHIDSWWCGEKNDVETGIHHLAHAATNLFFLMWFDENASS